MMKQIENNYEDIFIQTNDINEYEIYDYVLYEGDRGIDIGRIKNISVYLYNKR